MWDKPLQPYFGISCRSILCVWRGRRRWLGSFFIAPVRFELWFKNLSAVYEINERSIFPRRSSFIIILYNFCQFQETSTRSCYCTVIVLTFIFPNLYHSEKATLEICLRYSKAIIIAVFRNIFRSSTWEDISKLIKIQIWQHQNEAAGSKKIPLIWNFYNSFRQNIFSLVFSSNLIIIKWL